MRKNSFEIILLKYFNIDSMIDILTYINVYNNMFIKFLIY